MKNKMKRVLTMIHATSEIIVDYQREKGFKDHLITICALAITSFCRWGLEELDKENEG